MSEKNQYGVLHNDPVPPNVYTIMHHEPVTRSALISPLLPTEWSISFHADDKRIGRIWLEDGVLKFDGDMDESAIKFFEWIKPMVDNYIAQQMSTAPTPSP